MTSPAQMRASVRREAAHVDSHLAHMERQALRALGRPGGIRHHELRAMRAVRERLAVFARTFAGLGEPTRDELLPDRRRQTDDRQI